MNQSETPLRNDAAPQFGWKRRTYILALLLMALATLGFAWSTFQSSTWVGIQTFTLVDAISFSRRSDLQAAVANQVRLLDLALFIEYERASSERNGRLSRFLLDRMRPELREAMKVWVATRPLQNLNAPASPFDLPEYRVPAEVESKKLMARSVELYGQAEQANMTGDRYMLLTVLFTVSLFLSGLVGGLIDRRLRWTMLGFSMAILMVATTILVRLPIASPRPGMSAGPISRFPPNALLETSNAEANDEPKADSSAHRPYVQTLKESTWSSLQQA